MSECGHSQDGEYIACIHCDIEHAGNDGYREGIAWEQKRWEILLHVEYDCKCVTPLDHLRTRLERSENGIDYDREFDDTIGDIE